MSKCLLIWPKNRELHVSLRGQSPNGCVDHTYQQISLSAWREFCVEFLEVAIARARFVAL